MAEMKPTPGSTPNPSPAAPATVKAGLNGGLTESRYAPGASTNAGNGGKQDNKPKSRYKNGNSDQRTQQNQGRGQKFQRNNANNNKFGNYHNQKHQGSDSIQRGSGHTSLAKAPIHQDQVPSPNHKHGQTASTAIRGAESQGPLMTTQPPSLVSERLNTKSESTSGEIVNNAPAEVILAEPSAMEAAEPIVQKVTEANWVASTGTDVLPPKIPTKTPGLAQSRFATQTDVSSTKTMEAAEPVVEKVIVTNSVASTGTEVIAPSEPVKTPGLSASKFAKQTDASPPKTPSPVTTVIVAAKKQQELVPENSTENTAQTITALQAKIRDCESENATLKQQNSNYKVGWDRTKAERDVKDSERNEAFNKLSEANKQLLILRQKLSSAKTCTDMAAKNANDAKTELATSIASKAKLGDELSNVRAELDKCSNEKAEAITQKQAADAMSDLFKKNLENAKSTLKLQLEAAEKAAQEQIKTLEQNTQALKSELDDTRKSSASSSEEIASLKTEKEKLAQELAELKDSLAQSKVEVDVLKGEIKSLKVVHSNDTQKLARLSEADAEILQLKADLESANTTHLEELEKSARLSDTEAHVAQLEKQLEALSTARQADSEKLQRLSEAEARVIQLDNQVQQSSKDLATKACELEEVCSAKDALAEELDMTEVCLEIGENLQNQTKLKIEILEKELEEAKAVKVATVPQPLPRPELVNESTQTDVTIDAASETQITPAQHLLITPPPSPAKDDTSETQVSDAPAIPIPPPVLKYNASTQTAKKLKRSNIRLSLILFFSTIFAGFLIYQGLLSAYSSSSEVDISLNLTPPNGSSWDPFNALVGNTHSSNDTYSAETITANPFYQLPSESPKAVIEMPTSGLIPHISSEFAPTCDPSSRPGVFALMDPFSAQLSSTNDDDSAAQSILFSYFHAGLRIPLCTYRAVFTDTEVTFVDCLFGSS